MALKCDGSCDKHEGEVVTVNVKYIRTNTDWGEFNYCETAIKEDISRGLEVTIVNKSDGKGE